MNSVQQHEKAQLQSPDRFAVTDSNTVVYSISSGRIADVILGKFSV